MLLFHGDNDMHKYLLQYELMTLAKLQSHLANAKLEIM